MSLASRLRLPPDLHVKSGTGRGDHHQYSGSNVRCVQTSRGTHGSGSVSAFPLDSCFRLSQRGACNSRPKTTRRAIFGEFAGPHPSWREQTAQKICQTLVDGCVRSLLTIPRLWLDDGAPKLEVALVLMWSPVSAPLSPLRSRRTYISSRGM